MYKCALALGEEVLGRAAPDRSPPPDKSILNKGGKKPMLLLNQDRRLWRVKEIPVRADAKTRRHLAACLFALSFVPGVISKGLAGTDSFTTIDFPGASATSAYGISPRGDIVGQYLAPDRVRGYLSLSRSPLAPIHY